MSFAKWGPFCLGVNLGRVDYYGYPEIPFIIRLYKTIVLSLISFIWFPPSVVSLHGHHTLFFVSIIDHRMITLSFVVCHGFRHEVGENALIFLLWTLTVWWRMCKWNNWLITGQTHSHNFNQCWLIIYWTLEKPQWNSTENTKLGHKENSFENIVNDIAAVLFWPQYGDISKN